MGALGVVPISCSAAKKSSQKAAHKLGRKVDHRNDAGVVEPGGTDDTQDADDLALLVLKGGDDQRRARQREQLVLGTDENMHTLAALGEAQQLHQVPLGLQIIEQLPNAGKVLQPIDVDEQVGLAAQDKAFLLDHCK